MVREGRQSSKIAVSVTEETLKTALSLSNIRLLLVANDIENESELRRKMEHVESNLSTALERLQKQSKLGTEFSHLETERRSITIDSSVPAEFNELLDAYFDHVGEAVTDNPDEQRADIKNQLGNLLPETESESGFTW